MNHLEQRVRQLLEDTEQEAVKLENDLVQVRNRITQLEFILNGGGEAEETVTKGRRIPWSVVGNKPAKEKRSGHAGGWARAHNPWKEAEDQKIVDHVAKHSGQRLSHLGRTLSLPGRTHGALVQRAVRLAKVGKLSISRLPGSALLVLESVA